MLLSNCIFFKFLLLRDFEDEVKQLGMTSPTEGIGVTTSGIPRQEHREGKMGIRGSLGLSDLHPKLLFDNKKHL